MTQYMFIKTICHAEQDWGNGNIKSRRTSVAEMSYNKINGGEARADTAVLRNNLPLRFICWSFPVGALAIKHTCWGLLK